MDQAEKFAPTASSVKVGLVAGGLGAYWPQFPTCCRS